MNYSEADQRYQQLRQQWQSKQISEQTFRDQVDKLQLTGPDGAWWRIQPENGSWLRWDGTNWMATNPPSLSPTPGSAPNKKRRWWLACLILLLLSCCCLLVAGGGGYLALQAGSLSAMELSAKLTGAAIVDLANLDDQPLTVRYRRLDVPEEESSADSIRLAPFETGSFASLEPGRYRLEFESAGNQNLLLECTVRLENRDQLQLVAVPEGLAIVREGDNITDPQELDAATSSLCRQ